jgi:hypothetical protein
VQPGPNLVGLRLRPPDYKDGKLAELWRGPRTAAGEGWVSESVPNATPSTLTPVAVQLRTVGVRRAIPRRIHSVRVAISATARSERRIAETLNTSETPAQLQWLIFG